MGKEDTKTTEAKAPETVPVLAAPQKRSPGKKKGGGKGNVVKLAGGMTRIDY